MECVEKVLADRSSTPRRAQTLLALEDQQSKPQAPSLASCSTLAVVASPTTTTNTSTTCGVTRHAIFAGILKRPDVLAQRASSVAEPIAKVLRHTQFCCVLSFLH